MQGVHVGLQIIYVELKGADIGMRCIYVGVHYIPRIVGRVAQSV